MSTQRRAWLAAVVVCALARPAAAQPPAPESSQPPLTLEQLMSLDVERVFGASRFQQSVLEAPAAVSIVTRDDIERFGYLLLPHLTLQLDLRNLLDRQYGDPGAEEHRQALIPQDGRTLRLRATWRF